MYIEARKASILMENGKSDNVCTIKTMMAMQWMFIIMMHVSMSFELSD